MRLKNFYSIVLFLFCILSLSFLHSFNPSIEGDLLCRKHVWNDTDSINNFEQYLHDIHVENCIPRLRDHKQTFNVYTSVLKKVRYVRVFKVASGTIKDALMDQIPDLVQTYPTQLPKESEKYFTFAIVRNPWDRLLSCYFHKVVTRHAKEFKECFGKDFKFFVKFVSKLNLAIANPHIRLQTRLVPVQECDFIGKLENFQDDWQYICDQIGIEMRLLPHKHQTNHKHYSCYYDSEMIELVRKMYKEEIEAFGFEFNDHCESSQS